MKKIVVLLLAVSCLLGVCAGDMYAQKGRIHRYRAQGKKYKKPSRPEKRAKSHPLTNFRQASAITAQETEAGLQLGDFVPPASQFTVGKGNSVYEPLAGLRSHALYPQSNLPSTQELEEYFLNQHNSEIVKWMPILQAHQKALEENLPQLREAQQIIDHPARLDMKWLAGQLPDEARYLLLGEKDHGVYAVHQQVKYLLGELHRRYPHRKIILFTEFLPQGRSWIYAARYPGLWGYLPLFLAGQKVRIPVVGLEPKFVCETQRTMVEDPEQQTGGLMWASIEGVRIRNERWLARLEAARRQYPDALFVVYTGAGHVDYNEPYSLGRSLQGPQTQVVLFHPRYRVENGRLKDLITPFDMVTQGEFSDRIVRFNSDKLAKLAGFDIQIGVPELLETMFFDE